MIFLINLPIGILGLVCARRLPETVQPGAPRIDRGGTALATLALVLLLVPLLEGGHSGWPLWTWMSFGGSVLATVLFLRWERRVKARGGAPALDPALFAARRFAVGSGVVLLVYSTSTSFFLGFALLMQEGLGLSAFAAGTLFAPASLAFVAASLTAPRLVARFGERVIAGGVALYLAGTAAVAASVLIGAGPGRTGMGGTGMGGTVAALILFGMGQGLSMTPLLNLVMGATTEDQAGMAGGVVSTMQQIGGAVGVAVIAILLGRMLPEADHARAFAASLVYNLGALLVAALGILWLTRGAPPPPGGRG